MQRTITLATVCAICALALGCSATFPRIDPRSLSADQEKTLASLQKLDDWPLYSMTYYGDYSPLLTLKKTYFRLLGMERPQCTTVAALDGTAPVFGRNMDTMEYPALMVFTHPADGYASVSMVGISGVFGSPDLFGSADKRTALLYAPYCLSDGMNEWGLAVGDMTVLDTKCKQDPNKPTMFEQEAIRDLLDHTRTVEEAIAYLSRTNVSFPIVAFPAHLLIADVSGKSVVVEWYQGEIKVTRNEVPWQAATNFMLYGSEAKLAESRTDLASTGTVRKDINGKSYWRYLTAMEALERAGGQMSVPQAMSVLQCVALVRSKEIWYPTNWSVVYGLAKGSIDIAMGRNYGRVLHFDLEMAPR